MPDVLQDELVKTIEESAELRAATIAAATKPPVPRYLEWERAVEEEVLRIDIVRSVNHALQRGIKDQPPDFNKHKHVEVTIGWECAALFCGHTSWSLPCSHLRARLCSLLVYPAVL